MRILTRFGLAAISTLLPSLVAGQGASDSTLAVRPAGGAAAGPPVRQIATASAISTQPFSIISAVVELPDHRVLVNDGASRRLLLMDTTLTKVEVVLDSLSEFENTYGTSAGSLIPYRADSALFIDPVSLAVLVIDPTGRVVRVRSLWRPQDAGFFSQTGQGAYGWPAADGNGRIVFRISAQAAPPKIAPPPGVPWIPQQPDSAFVVAINIDTRKLDTLGSLRIPAPQLQIRMTAQGSLSLYQTINPLPRTDDWAVMSDGSVAFVRGQDYRVEFVAPDGTRTSSPNLPYDWRRLTDELKEKLIDSVKTANRKTRLTSYTSSMIRWVNMYKKQYPPNFKAADDYVPPNGFLKDWKFPDGVKFPATYIYGCAPGEEPKMIAGAPGATSPPASGAPTIVVRGGTTSPGPAAGIPSCIPAPSAPAGMVPSPPQYQDVAVVSPDELPDYRPAFAQYSVRADADNNLWIRPIQTKPVPGGNIYDVVNRQGQMIDRLQLPPGYTVVGFGRGRVVYLSMRDAKGLHLARIQLR